jgi:uncharacterized C2H2 Zn-finger protein
MGFNCDKCTRVFKSQFLLTKHTNSTFPCDTIFKCSDCEEVFTTKFLLTRHENRKIPCDTVFKCSDCEEVFENNFLLIRHRNKKNSCSSKTTTLQLQIQLTQLQITQEERKFKHKVELRKQVPQKRKEKIALVTNNVIDKAAEYKQYVDNETNNGSTLPKYC